MANNSSIVVEARGTAEIHNEVQGKITKVSLSDALYVPDLHTNLISVSKITDKGFKVLFKKDKAEVLDKNGNIRMTANRMKNLYYVDDSNKSSVVARVADTSSSSRLSLETWHKRMGHLNVKDLVTACNNGVLRGIGIKQPNEEMQCETCLKGKMTKLSFPINIQKSLDILEIIHSDVCGPMRQESLGRAKYFVTFIDESTRWCEVRFLRSKNEVFNAFKEVKAMFENVKGKKIKYLQSDNGTEYVNLKFEDLLKNFGIQRRLSVPYNPEQNGLAERKNRTLLDMARCLLIDAGLPPRFWAEAVNTANYLRNRCPTTCLDGKSPYEVWHGKPPNVSHLREFGCKVYCLDTSTGRSKLEARSTEGVLVGYSETSKGYRVWVPADRKVTINRNIKFLEGSRAIRRNPEESILKDEKKAVTQEPHVVDMEIRNDVSPEDNEYVEDDLDTTEDESSRSEASKRGRGRPRILKTGERGRPRKQYQVVTEQARDDEAAQISDEVEMALLSEISISEAITGNDMEEWLDAMTNEVSSIVKNNTWELVKRPENKTVIGSRFVLRNKLNPDGSILKRKARLVAQGFLQKPGIHFKETFSPVARLSSVRIIVAAATKLNMKIHQFDVSTAYLNGEIQEELFMEPPKYLK